MKTITCENGVKLTHDDELKLGDMIIAYHAGYHELAEIKDRGENVSPLFGYRTVFNSSGKPIKGKKLLWCDASYCRRALAYLNKSIAETEEILVSLNKLKQQLI